jgi:hypothetical protein
LSAFLLRAAPAMADDEYADCSDLGNCNWCDSGRDCTLVTGDPEACNQWDNTSDSCDPAVPTFCGTTVPDDPARVKCRCQLCIGG